MKGAVEEKSLSFSGNKKDFHAFRTAPHTTLEEKDLLWISPSDCQGLPKQCRGKDRAECYQTHEDRKSPTEIWEDNASCIMASENLTNRDRPRHVDVTVRFSRDLVRDGHVKLLKCAGPHNVSDTLTKSLPRPAFEKHREFMVGKRVPFSEFHAKVTKAVEPMWFMSLSRLFLCILRSVLSLIVRADNYSSARGRAK